MPYGMPKRMKKNENSRPKPVAHEAEIRWTAPVLITK
jgi:hypothetical protein